MNEWQRKRNQVKTSKPGRKSTKVSKLRRWQTRNLGGFWLRVVAYRQYPNITVKGRIVK